MNALDRRVSVAPMMDWTDRHCRYFLRGFSPHVLLYTEMVTAAALIHGDAQRLLRFDEAEHPVALQLGGSDPEQLARAARLGEAAGYREINLNCGCPSDRVHAGAFGACLMLRPSHVVTLVEAMRAEVRIPVTVKLRIGVVDATGGNASMGWRDAVARFDEADRDALHSLVSGLVKAGTAALIVHARKAVLGAFSPRDNREVPPLRYDEVEALRPLAPGVPLILNGGLRLVPEALNALNTLAGVMLGREAYHRPQVLGELHTALVERRLWPDDGFRVPDAGAQVERMIAYAERELAEGQVLGNITRHMLGLLSHTPGAKEFRRLLSEGARDRAAGIAPLRRALDLARAA
ncbi:MAG: tRNA dihydrouridine(20/20a) synthase DusA [Steroidobacteraceae bacterium]